MIDPESIEVDGVYRTMEAFWTVTEIVDGKVKLRRDDGKLARFGLEHFAQIVERRVTPIEGAKMAGLSKHARDKLLTELQSGTMKSGVATFTLHQPPAETILDWWSKAQQPTHGMLIDPLTGQSWPITSNQDTKQWEIDPTPIEGGRNANID